MAVDLAGPEALQSGVRVLDRIEDDLVDLHIRSVMEERISDDPEISTLGITASVLNGKVMLVGTVKTEELKTRIERMVKQVKGVKEVDNQITVLA